MGCTPHLSTAVDVSWTVPRSQHQNHGAAESRRRLDALSHLKSIHPRHMDIGQDDPVGSAGLLSPMKLREGRLAIGDRCGTHVPAYEDLREE